MVPLTVNSMWMKSGRKGKVKVVYSKQWWLVSHVPGNDMVIFVLHKPHKGRYQTHTVHLQIIVIFYINSFLEVYCQR